MLERKPKSANCSSYSIIKVGLTAYSKKACQDFSLLEWDVPFTLVTTQYLLLTNKQRIDKMGNLLINLMNRLQSAFKSNFNTRDPLNTEAKGTPKAILTETV